MELSHEFHEMIERDIIRIEESVIKGNDDSRWSLFRELEGRYQACIKDFYLGLCFSNSEKNMVLYSMLKQNPVSVTENLQMIKAKLESLRFEANIVHQKTTPAASVNVNVNISMSFEEAKQKIEDMPGLNDSDTEEIKGKIDDLESISKENLSKKKKWEKVKQILLFALDKGADVAITIMGLILQMQLGM